MVNYLKPVRKDVRASTGAIYARLVGGSFHKTAFDAVEVGQQLMLHKDIENKYDSYAIRVLTNNKNLVGYIANRKDTLGSNSRNISAADLYEHINNDSFATVISKSEYAAVLVIDASNEAFMSLLGSAD